MLIHTLAELFGNIVFNFTRSVAERYDFGESDDVVNMTVTEKLLQRII